MTVSITPALEGYLDIHLFVFFFFFWPDPTVFTSYFWLWVPGSHLVKFREPCGILGLKPVEGKHFARDSCSRSLRRPLNRPTDPPATGNLVPQKTRPSCWEDGLMGWENVLHVGNPGLMPIKEPPKHQWEEHPYPYTQGIGWDSSSTLVGLLLHHCMFCLPSWHHFPNVSDGLFVDKKENI